jgi:hypothetical protein
MRPVVIVPVLFILSLAGCSSPSVLSSRWRGGQQDPSHAGSYFVKDDNITVSVENDAEYLYLSVGVADRMRQRQISFRGLTVWFDRKGGDEKRFGIQYPMAADMQRGGGRRAEAGEAADTSWSFPENISTDLEILGPGEGEHHRMTMAETKGISVTLDHEASTLYYNVKVPLTDNGAHLYGIGASAGAAVGIGVESPEFIRANGDGRGEDDTGGGTPGGGMGRGGRGGGRGGRGGGGGMPRGGGQDGSRRGPEPLKFWATVTLAPPGGGN